MTYSTLRKPNRRQPAPITAEDMIGGEVIDALGNGWLEIRMPDGRVYNVEAMERRETYKHWGEARTVTIAELEIREAAGE